MRRPTRWASGCWSVAVVVVAGVAWGLHPCWIWNPLSEGRRRPSRGWFGASVELLRNFPLLPTIPDLRPSAFSTWSFESDVRCVFAFIFRFRHLIMFNTHIYYTSSNQKWLHSILIEVEWLKIWKAEQTFTSCFGTTSWPECRWGSTWQRVPSCPERSGISASRTTVPTCSVGGPWRQFLLFWSSSTCDRKDRWRWRKIHLCLIPLQVSMMSIKLLIYYHSDNINYQLITKWLKHHSEQYLKLCYAKNLIELIL